MKAYKARDTINGTHNAEVKGYYCENCETEFVQTESNAEPWDEGKAYWCSGNIDGADYYQSASLEDVWYCGSGCFHHDAGFRPELTQVWICGECESMYVDEDEAVACCT